MQFSRALPLQTHKLRDEVLTYMYLCPVEAICRVSSCYTWLNEKMYYPLQKGEMDLGNFFRHHAPLSIVQEFALEMF